ncbi:MAG: entericidin A/B family lipoprotein [Xanthomonadales bacterium]|nr:entericidin A/B family lipoprotein [Xanthomonadales bacterium]
MKTSFRWVVLLAMLTSFCLATGCNTVRGVGKDIETAGKSIQKKSNRDD